MEAREVLHNVLNDFARYTGLQYIDTSQEPYCFRLEKSGTLFMETREDKVILYLKGNQDSTTDTRLKKAEKALMRNHFLNTRSEVDVNVGLDREGEIVFVVKITASRLDFPTFEKIVDTLKEFNIKTMED